MNFLEAAKQIKEFYGKDFQMSHTHKIIFELCQNVSIYGEIGSHKGCSMVMAALANPKLQIRCFDCPNNGWGGQSGTDTVLKKAREKFSGERCLITFGDSHHKTIKDTISEMGPYDVFLVDGDHSVEGMKEDFAAVWPHIKKGGCVIIDDLIHHPELNVAFNELLEKLPGHQDLRYLELTKQEEEIGLLLRGVGVIWK